MNDATLMLRQIHPSFIKQGQITSQAFRPTIKDDKKLSVYDNDMITAEKAYEHYTKKLFHDMAKDLVEVGAMDEVTMRTVESLCLPEKKVFLPEDIRRIRTTNHLSQPVFALISAFILHQAGLNRTDFFDL